MIYFERGERHRTHERERELEVVVEVEREGDAVYPLGLVLFKTLQPLL